MSLRDQPEAVRLVALKSCFDGWDEILAWLRGRDHGSCADVLELAADGKLVSPLPLKHLKRADELLQNVAAGLNALPPETKLGCVEVVFHGGEYEPEMNPATALDYLANDIYWNEEGDWSEATTAEVRVL